MKLRLQKELRLRNCGDAVAEQHSFKSCGIAIAEVLTSSYGIAIAEKKKLRMPTSEHMPRAFFSTEVFYKSM
jgi:hypothetical protein